jgi:hypothetical protein
MRNRMNFDQFLEQAWSAHGDNSYAVGEQLKTARALLTQSQQVDALARILVHVFGEHLGEWSSAQRELSLLQEHPLCRSDPQAVSAVRVAQAALSLAQGVVPQGAKLTDEERVRALSSACAICLGREELGNASDLFDLCLKLVALLPPASAGFHRLLAVAANNLTCALGELALRSEVQDAQMIKAAQTARQYWELAGTWLETQRADYVLAKSCLRAGHLPAAASHAVDCLNLCRANDAAPIDLFFAHEIAALAAKALGYGSAFEAARQSALNAFDALDAQYQAAAQAERDALLA